MVPTGFAFPLKNFRGGGRGEGPCFFFFSAIFDVPCSGKVAARLGADLAPPGLGAGLLAAVQAGAARHNASRLAAGGPFGVDPLAWTTSTVTFTT